MKLRIIGDSDVVALGRAYQKFESVRGLFSQYECVEFSKLFPFPLAMIPFWESNGDEISINRSRKGIRFRGDPGYSKFRKELDVIYAVSMPYRATVSRNPAWTRCAPWKFPVKGRAAISEGIIERAVQSNLINIVGFLRELKQFCGNLVIIEAPPIRDARRYFRDKSTSEEGTYFLEAFCREIVDREMENLGLSVVNCPVETYRSTPRSSYLRPEFHTQNRSDNYHANAQYGELHLRDLAFHLESSGLQ